MIKLDAIQPNTQLNGIVPGEAVRIVQIEPAGDGSVTVYYKNAQGKLGEQMLFRSDEAKLSVAAAGSPWQFDAPGGEFIQALEALRINLAHLFDPMMAVHTSNVDPYPHQISAVYEAMLPKQPLRFVLADDPGAGKTIMAGLLIRELIMRADVRRVLIVAPGSLTEQWQEELLEKFNLEFKLFSREKQEESGSGNYFDEKDQLICRLDQISRSEDFQHKLGNTDWDLIIVDEAHKLSASYFGREIKETKRFKLGKLLGSITRHFLLMTATPHNGKEEDFQIWLSLLDDDRFVGRFREGTHKVDVSDLMRRMVKEELLKFDGTRLFPERRAYTANYELSEPERLLYADVTEYVRNEMNRADKLLDKRRGGTIGFALTMLQRRLASSPEAIFQSLKRRSKRLEDRLEETKRIARGEVAGPDIAETLGEYTVKRQIHLPEDYDELDEELNAEEYENFTEQVVDQASAAETIPELEAEIATLQSLRSQALRVVQLGTDKKWEELSHLLQDRPEMFTESGHRRKLIVFTEHKDTLNYLVQRIGDTLGSPDAVVAIHGGVSREHRRKVQEEFRNLSHVVVMVATDAAGEGVNLQNANLMVNYDLPWNPNRLEQRFGRIHRIGQTEICHLWNLVAAETREGAVFQRLFEKIEIERLALGGQVYDILGEAFEGMSLKDLLVEAIRYEESPEAKARPEEKLDTAINTEKLEEILRRNALVEQHIGTEQLYAVKDQMEKAEARKLQPYFVRSFFEGAFSSLDGQLRPRETGRFEVRHVPAAIRAMDRQLDESRTPVLQSYERVCFEKDRIRVKHKPVAELLHPGHPLLRAITELILREHRSKLKQGAVLVDPTDPGTDLRVLVMIDHKVRETAGKQRIASRRLQFVTIDATGKIGNAGWGPHLDLVPITDQQCSLLQDLLAADWIGPEIETLAIHHAAGSLVQEHFDEVRQRRERQSERVLAAVQERLVKEINYWQDRFIELTEAARVGKQPKVQPEYARRQVDELKERLKTRQRELKEMAGVVSSTPVVVGAALVVPQGLIAQRSGDGSFSNDAAARARIEKIAMDAVMDKEREFGFTVTDVAAQKCGWDVTSRPPLAQDGSMPADRHIEVKGRAQGADFITVTRNEIFTSFNQGDKYILAIVLVNEDDSFNGPYYIIHPFDYEPGWATATENCNLKALLERAASPEATVQRDND